LQQNPEPARFVPRVQLTEHDLTGPLAGGTLDDRQVQAVVMLGSRRVPVFKVFECERGVSMASSEPLRLRVNGEQPPCVGLLDWPQQDKFPRQGGLDREVGLQSHEQIQAFFRD